MIRLSVVIPTFERSARLRSLIAALEAQTLPTEEFEVIVADDGSRDETQRVLAELAERTPINLRVVRNVENRGPSAARNLGWRASQAPIIAFTDDDCIPSPGWLEAGLARFEGTRAGIVQGRTIPDPATPMTGWAKTLRYEQLSGLYESCNVFYRKDVLSSVEGFDEEITVPFGEDTAVGWKARRHGVSTEFAYDALVLHDVTYPPLRYWWRYAMMHGHFATLVRRFPEMRRELLWCRLFVWRDHAVFDAAVFGAVTGFLWWPAFALVLPYLYLRRPRRLSRYEVKVALVWPLYDAAILVGLLKGSLRERTLVL